MEHIVVQCNTMLWKTHAYILTVSLYLEILSDIIRNRKKSKKEEKNKEKRETHFVIKFQAFFRGLNILGNKVQGSYQLGVVVS